MLWQARCGGWCLFLLGWLWWSLYPELDYDGGCVLNRTVLLCDLVGLVAVWFLLVGHPCLILWSSQRLLFITEWNMLFATSGFYYL